MSARWPVAILFTLFSGSALAAEFHVRPTGSASGDGSPSAPWDLATALDHPSSVRPGDTVWLHGGTYGSGGATVFTSTLSGTQAAPITVRAAKGERPIVDGGISAQGAFTVFWGFEITNSSTDRVTRPTGLNLLGRGHKAINLVIYNAGHPAIGFWEGVGDGGEVYGLIAWGNGIYGGQYGAAGAGSAVYAQNKTGQAALREIIGFRHIRPGINVSSAGVGFVSGWTVEGNVLFDNGDHNFFAAAKANPVSDFKLISNYLYRRPDDPLDSVELGYEYWDIDNQSVEVRDNTFVAGTTREADRGVLFVEQFQNARVTGNTFVGGRVLVRWEPAAGGTAVWNNNRYHTPYATGFDHQGQLDFAAWKASTGFDAQSTFSSARPTANQIHVRPNAYEPGRGNVIVYNWEERASVDVDLRTVVAPGARFEVRDAQNFFGPPVASGTYAGGSVSLPMNLTAVGDIPGVTTLDNVHTPPEFNVFVVLSDAGPVTPPPTPDAGVPQVDGGTQPVDAGTHPMDAGPAIPADAGVSLAPGAETESGAQNRAPAPSGGQRSIVAGAGCQALPFAPGVLLALAALRAFGRRPRARS